MSPDPCEPSLVIASAAAQSQSIRYFLCSGPQIPANGGFLLARAESREKLEALLADEPYTKAKKMRFSRINPVQHQAILKDWFSRPEG